MHCELFLKSAPPPFPRPGQLSCKLELTLTPIPNNKHPNPNHTNPNPNPNPSHSAWFPALGIRSSIQIGPSYTFSVSYSVHGTETATATALRNGSANTSTEMDTDERIHANDAATIKPGLKPGPAMVMPGFQHYVSINQSIKTHFYSVLID